MDERRIDTAGFLAMGGLNRPVPETDIPETRERAEWEDVRGDGKIAEALDAGKLVNACNYYGIPYAWREAEGAYRGILLQYRVVTESVTFATAVECADWFDDVARRTDG